MTRKIDMTPPSPRLHLGCGANVLNGWINVDYALGARLARSVPFFGALNRRLHFTGVDWDDRIVLHDLRKRFPWPDDSVATIYTSHTLEHFSREDGQALLAECFRVLRPGGVLRIVVPDLAPLVRRYVSGETSADRFVESLQVLYKPQRSLLKRFLTPWVQFPHRCMYDESSLRGVCNAIGFRAAACLPFDSAIPDIRDIEKPDRTVDAVIVEAVKP